MSKTFSVSNPFSRRTLLRTKPALLLCVVGGLYCISGNRAFAQTATLTPAIVLKPIVTVGDEVTLPIIATPHKTFLAAAPYATRRGVIYPAVFTRPSALQSVVSSKKSPLRVSSVPKVLLTSAPTREARDAQAPPTAAPIAIPLPSTTPKTESPRSKTESPRLAQVPATPPAAAPVAPEVAPAPATAGAPMTAPAPMMAPAPAMEIKRNAAGEPLVTNSFADTDIKQALSDVSLQTGVSIVADNTVQGTVTLELKDVPLEKALTMILRGGGYAFALTDDYYLVGAPDPTNPNFYLLSSTEVVQLRNIRPEVVLQLLAVPYGRYLSAEAATRVPVARGGTLDEGRRSVGFGGSSLGGNNQRNNDASTDVGQPSATYKVAITAPPSLIPRIKADIARLDQRRNQIVLEAMVLEITQDDLKDIGFNFASRYLQFSTANGNSNFSYSSVTNDNLVQIAALVQKGAARLRANPRVATGDGQTAEVEVGRENYFTIITGTTNFAYNTLEVIRSGISLRVTPRILDDGKEVLALVEPEVRDVTGRSANGLPEITFRRAAANIQVKDGESIVISGLTNEFDTTNNTKIPILGDIPLIGKAFRGSNTRRLKTETVFIITPRIIKNGESLDGIRSSVLRQDLNDLRTGVKPDPFVKPTQPVPQAKP